MTAALVLVVEDDHGLRDVIRRGLERQGHTVLTAADGETALGLVARHRVDVVLMDINLPDSDGRDVCTAMRARGIQAPVVFLTARDGLTDRLSGFASGGDDYVTKPFHVDELSARVQALLKRTGGPGAPTAGDLTLNPASHDLTCGDQVVSLSPTEFRLLAVLLARQDAVVRRRELTAAGWPVGAIVSDNTVDQYISRIRRKLTVAGSTQQVSAVKGVGFRLG